jgi:hypothetical protein
MGWCRRVVWAILALYALALLYGIASHPDRFQWDFRTYYYAGRAFSLGLDPYDMGALTRVAGVEIGFPYAYSPLVLPLFSAMGAIELAAASAVFLGFKVVALIALLALWRRWFVVGRPDPFFYLFLLFGFSGALYSDFASGNISVFEQLGFWLGFVALRRGRLWAFSLLVIAISLFKLTPVLLLLMLPLLYGLRRPAGPLAGGLLIFAAALGVSYVLWPDLFRSFLQGGWSFDERGGINPSSLALLRDGYDYLLERGFLPRWGWMPWAAYALWVTTVALLTWRAARRLPADDRTASIYLGCLAFALIAPRFKNYSYTLLLVPAYQLLTTRIAVRPERAILLLLMFSGSPPVPFGFSTAAGEIITGYYSLLGALLVWSLALRGGRPGEAAEAPGLPGPADPGPMSKVARVDDD